MICIALLKEFMNEYNSSIWLYAISAGLTYVLMAVIIPVLYSKIGDIETSMVWKTVLPWIISAWLLYIIFFITKRLMIIKLEPALQDFLKKHMIRLYLEKHELEYTDSNVSLHMMNLMTAVQSITAIFMWILETVLPVLILLIIITGYLCYRVPLLGILLVCFTGLVIGTISCQLSSVIERFHLEHQDFTTFVGKLDNSFSNLMNIYLNDSVDQTLKEHDTYDKEFIHNTRSHKLRLNLFVYSLRFIVYGFALISLVYLFLQWRRNRITKTMLFELGIIILFYCGGFDMLCDQSIIISKDIIVAISFEPLLQVKSIQHTQPLSSAHSITFDQVSCAINDKMILRSLCLELKAGERIALTGQSGSGKSTLVKLVLGFMKLTSGKIFIDGIDVATLSIRDVRTHIHYINQRTHLFEETILNNMMYGTTATREDIINVLTAYDLWSIFDESGQASISSIERPVVLHGSNLSLGMQKVIIMIRGLFHPCSILFIDEPFTSLDQMTRTKMLRLIDHQTKGKTLCIITHDMDGIEQIVDRVVHINELM